MNVLYRSPGIQAMCAAGQTLHFVKGDAVGSTDGATNVNFVMSGYVKRYLISNSGRLGVQIIYGPQDVFSLTQLYPLLLDQKLYDGQEVYYYEAMSDVTILRVDAKTLTDHINSDPLLYKELFSEAGHHLKTCVHTIENMTFDSMYKRMAHQLAFFARGHGQAVPDGIKIAIPLTHQDLSDILETTRETATRAIVALRKNGLIYTDRGITVRDLAALDAAVYE